MKFFDRELGFTKAGLELPSMEEMIQQNYKKLEEKTDMKIDRASDGPIGQLFEISSKFWLDTWKQLQVFVGLFAYPRGMFADWFAGYTGFKRLGAVKASAVLDIYGKTGVKIKASELAKFSDTNGNSWTRKFAEDGLGTPMEKDKLTGNVQFPRMNITSFLINWNEFNNNPGNLQIINHRTNIPYTMIEVKNSDTKETLQARFDSVLNRFSVVKNFQGNESFWLCKMPFGEVCGIEISGDCGWEKMIATPLQVYVENSDYKNGDVLGAHQINKIDSQVTELFACTNPIAIFRARGVETDMELFQRMQYSRRLYGGSSAKAIEQRIQQEIPNVSFCRIMENATSAPKKVKEGLYIPPKSIMPIIEGGNRTGIENFLFKYLPASTNCFGVDFKAVRMIKDPITQVDVFDQAIGWNCPKPRHIQLKIEILEYHKDNPFPVDGVNRIKEEIVKWAYGRYDIGEDLILKDFYTPINKVIGTARVNILQRNVQDGYQDKLSGKPYEDNDVYLWDEYVHINDIQVA